MFLVYGIMINTIKQYSFVTKISKSGKPVPVINGIHLHSAYNPAKEAASLISKYEYAITDVSKFLIFGLGFAYHINQLVEKIKNKQVDDYRVFVIEPNEKTTAEVSKQKLISDYKNISILSNKEAKELYDHDELIEFMLSSPTIIAHPASFNLYRDYFREFMTYKAPITIKDLIEGIGYHNNDLSKSIERYKQDSIFEASKKIKSARILEPYTMLLGAFLSLSEDQPQAEY